MHDNKKKKGMRHNYIETELFAFRQKMTQPCHIF